MEFKRVDTSTIEGLEEAEELKDSGEWEVYRTSMFSTTFWRYQEEGVMGDLVILAVVAYLLWRLWKIWP